MEIKFENTEAQLIYDNVLKKCPIEEHDNVREIFRIAQTGDMYHDVLSESEASAVEGVLNDQYKKSRDQRGHYKQHAIEKTLLYYKQPDFFENTRAEEIYDRVLRSCTPRAREEAQRLFDLAFETYPRQLSAVEAEDVLDALNTADKGAFAGIRVYTLKEVEKASLSFHDLNWEICENKRPGQEQAVLLEDFIAHYPESPNLPEALYRLAIADIDYDKSIDIFEKLIERYPDTSQAIDALEKLIDFYTYSGNDDRAFASATSWLQSEPYTPGTLKLPSNMGQSDTIDYLEKMYSRAECSLPRDYNTVKSKVLLVQARYHQTTGDVEQAIRLYKDIVDSGAEFYSQVAAGALFELTQNPEFENGQTAYREYQMGILEKKGQYRLYARQDTEGSREIFSKILELAQDSAAKDYADHALMALREIEIRQIHTAEEILQAIQSLRESGELETFCRYQQISWYGLEMYKVPAENYLAFFLLSGCDDVEGVSFPLIHKDVSVDGETKTPQDNCVVAYKSKGQWRFVDFKNVLTTDDLSLRADSLEGLIQQLQETSGWQGHFIPSEPDGLFAGSLQDYYDEDSRLDSFFSALDLGEKKKQDLAREFVDENGLSRIVTFLYRTEAGTLAKRSTIGDDFVKKTHSRLGNLAIAYDLVPVHFWKGLKQFSFSEELECTMHQTNNIAGCYDDKDIKIDMQIDRGMRDTIVHESAHHLNFALLRDHSHIFYQLDWVKMTRSKVERYMFHWIWNPAVFRRKEGAEQNDFAAFEGQENPQEDFAYFAKEYFGGSFDLRLMAREQMEQGNFEPAVKYLYMKYIAFYDPRDGLCYEYGINDDSPPLSLEEVKEAMEGWLEENPDSIDQDTIDAVPSIEEDYREFRSNPGEYFELIGN